MTTNQQIHDKIKVARDTAEKLLTQITANGTQFDSAQLSAANKALFEKLVSTMEEPALKPFRNAGNSIGGRNVHHGD